MSTGIRAIQATAICALMGGCSWMFMSRPPEVVAAPNAPIDCTTSRAAPVLDTICSGYFLVNGIYFAAVQDCDSASFGQTCASSGTKAAGVVLSAGLGALCGFSAASGYGYADHCQQKKDFNALCITGDQRACRALRPGWAPAPTSASGGTDANPSPDFSRGCARDTDCKGDRICVSGSCTFPSTAVPPARSPPATSPPAQSPPATRPPAPPANSPNVPRCETDSDCGVGVCFEGACRN